VTFHALRAQEEPLADRLIRTALGHLCENLALAGGKAVDRALFPAVRDEGADDLGVDNRLTPRYATDGLTEFLDACNTRVQQISDRLAVACDKPQRVRRLELVGQQQESDVGKRAADPFDHVGPRVHISCAAPDGDNYDLGRVRFDEPD
jgi:hypothetical protein